jgi:hypothetical protein
MPHPLQLRAGPRALATLRERGLTPELVGAVSAASGGPKWLILSEFDRFFFGEWLCNASQPITLTGSSIGAWRMAIQAQHDPDAALDRFLESYLHDQRYPKHPGPAVISTEARRLVDVLLGAEGAAQATDNPQRPLQVITTRLNGDRPRGRLGMILRLMAAAGANRRDRHRIGRWVTRSLFETSAAHTALPDPDDLPTERQTLDSSNLRPALLASGAIPGVMETLDNIPGGPAGTYLDGGVTDYHPALPYNLGDQIIAFPHFYGYAIPGWFDKKRRDRWNRLPGMDNTLVIAPSEEHIAALPYGKIPDRKDFYRLSDSERIPYWQRVVEASREMGEAFMELVESGRAVDAIRPLEGG